MHIWFVHCSSQPFLTVLSIPVQVARLLLDTSALQFYPSRFLLVTDVLDMLGDLVWDRIKRKAEYCDEGDLMCHLPGVGLSLLYCVINSMAIIKRCISL